LPQIQGVEIMGNKRAKLYDLIDANNPSRVLEEINYLLKCISNDIKRDRFEKIYTDVILLFEGKFPGYLASNTKYHDLEHTSAVTLAVSRLIHGACIKGLAFDPDNIITTLAAALFHDVGLIQTSDDPHGTGAKYTIGHEEKSIAFLKKYFLENHFSSQAVDVGSKCIMCTILSLSPKEIPFKSDETKTLGYMVGSSDILAQMADRYYLEKLLLLFQEFEEAGIPDLGSEMELLEKTEYFYHTIAKKRLLNDFEGVSAYMHAHFFDRWGIDKDLYDNSISNNIHYISTVSERCRDSYTCYLDSLKRGGIIKKILGS